MIDQLQDIITENIVKAGNSTEKSHWEAINQELFEVSEDELSDAKVQGIGQLYGYLVQRHNIRHKVREHLDGYQLTVWDYIHNEPSPTIDRKFGL